MSSSIPPTTSYYPETSGTATGATAPDAGGSTSGTTQVAKEQAASVAGEAKASGQHVAGVAKDQAAGVAGEARRQAADLLHSGRGELKNQVSSQQHRAASGIRSLGDELMAMANGEGSSSGLAADLVHEVSTRASSVATWLEQREPSDVLDEVTRFARRRPGAFLAIAASIGVVAGRLTRGMADNAKHSAEASAVRSSTGTSDVDLTDSRGTGYATTSQQPLDELSQQSGTVYPTGTPAYGTEPLDASGADVFGEPRRGVTP
jgi:hypothetical protein